MPPSSLTQLTTEVDKCVLCGTCLKVCPTYHLYQHEAESPRGRLALISGVAQGQLEVSPRLLEHIDHCLGCRACESSCPSGVPIIQLLDWGKEITEPYRPDTERHRRKQLLDWIAKPGRLKRLGRTLWLAQKSGLIGLARHTGIVRLLGVKRLEPLLPPLEAPKAFQSYYPAQGEERDQVTLFHGCLAQTIDRNTIEAAIQLLTQIGIGVHLPQEPSCCGALHQHNGQPDQGGEMAQQTLELLQAANTRTILFLATGCGLQLIEHNRLTQKDMGSEIKLMEVSAYLAEMDRETALTFAPYAQKIAIHEPCTQRQIPGLRDAIAQLLQRIPELQANELTGNHTCCGAGGGNLITDPEQSEQLRKRHANEIAQQNPDLILTTNIGCAIQLIAGQREQDHPVRVIHPVTLLAELYRDHS